MQPIDVFICETLPDRAELDGILRPYYATVVSRMRAIGFDVPDSAPQSALAEFWENANDYMPPDGCIALARDAGGTLVGVGMMKRHDDHTGDLKRIFVTDAARGTGTGRRLVQTLVAHARAKGLTRLVADTMRSNVEMRSLFPNQGFIESETPIETTTYRDQPVLRPIMHYFYKDLDSA